MTDIYVIIFQKFSCTAVGNIGVYVVYDKSMSRQIFLLPVFQQIIASVWG